jgi:hypothetical protein
LSTVGATAPTVATYDATAKTYTFEYTAPTTATGTALQISLDESIQPTKVTAFGTPVNSVFFNVNAVDLATQVTALTAQVAALTADYNKLATRWNARYDLKKAPKKKVALK